MVTRSPGACAMKWAMPSSSTRASGSCTDAAVVAGVGSAARAGLVMATTAIAMTASTALGPASVYLLILIIDAVPQVSR